MFKKLVAAAFVFGAGMAHAFIPQAGTWVVTSEVNGKPGRGFGIDVQNGTLVMQMYAYENTGKSTFYLAVGNVVDNQVTADLKSYEGGRFLGSEDRSGTEKGNAGAVKIRFVDGVSGFITFPGESEKAISRFNFGYAAVPQSLKGSWLFTTYSPTLGWGVETPTFTAVGNATSTGSGPISAPSSNLMCEHQVSGGLAGFVFCVKFFSNSSTTQHTYLFKYSVNEGEGDWYPNNGKTGYGFYVKRLVTDDGQVAGLIRKDEEAFVAPEQAQAFAAELAAAAHR